MQAATENTGKQTAGRTARAAAIGGLIDGSDGAKTGDVLTVAFELDGKRSLGLNGGPAFQFNEAISLMIDCDDQAEVDYYWDAFLNGGGAPSACGWLKDRFGLSWQVTPRVLLEMIRDSDTAKAKRAFEAMMGMVKLDIAALRVAFEGA